jgi:L-fucose mutarotase
MLKNIPAILSPELLKVMMEMGHGDEIVIADGNFPSAPVNSRVIRLDGHGVPEVLEAVLKLLPLDYAAGNMFLMDLMESDRGKIETPIRKEYERIAKASGDVNYKGYGLIDRFAFYDRARKAYAVIATGEKALYANILLKKGVI